MPIFRPEASSRTIIRERIVTMQPAATEAEAVRMRRDALQLDGSALGGLAGVVAGTTIAAAARVNPIVAILGGLTVGVLAGRSVLGGLSELAIVRHTMAASVGAMAGGGAMAVGALSLGATSGALVAGAAAVGVVMGAYGLAKLASLTD